ncbi:MAG: helix-turn-helix domain-containing protein [Bacteroidetes bacterium]|nr:helix-turn-helix domain-containing protein [Bacteroidota bacterium]MBU1422140.1 helix-turn-helix domain-containing protein [Bacteroidota bacterium]MBU2470878.1 helix-turn-helix domain-containing protein [Bacteroidota bacterium]MBU2636071.1 helix-turn-helix domain-containing protein [Bacteroidota bacterium]MDI6779794.1 helix-turn-helix domain-containing protein [Bacteroidota bacterium]
MNECGEELRAARLTQEISLEDISSTTRINVKFLKAIEDGNFSILPQTYIRAFIRTYAVQVGLDPALMVKKYEQQAAPGTPPSSFQDIISPVKVRLPKQKGASQTTVLIIVSVIIIIGLVFTLSVINNNKATQKTETKLEMKIDSLFLPEDQVPSGTQQATTTVQLDSLILNVSATESAWISVIIDDKTKKEILLSGEKSIQWKAANQFRITVGNAGSTVIKLNNYAIKPLGKRGAIVRDYIVNRSTLDTLRVVKKNQ